MVALVAKMCRGNEGSKPARVETIDRQTEGFAAVRAILARSGARPSARCRGISEDDLYAVRDAVMARNEWLKGVTVESDAKWPHDESVRSIGAICDATKFAKRLIWCEAALRLTLFVRGNEDLTGWRRKMAFVEGMDGGSASESEGGGSAAEAASAASAAEIDDAAAHLLGTASTPPPNQESLAQARVVSPTEYFGARPVASATKAMSVAEVYDEWRAEAREENDGEDAPEAGKARGRMDALSEIDDFLVWEHGGSFLRISVPHMTWGPDTQPGDAYMGALQVGGDNIKRMARAVSAVMSTEGATDGLLRWAHALIDELGIGTEHGDALEVLLISARPGITLEQRIADTKEYCSGGTYEALAMKMGWASNLRRGSDVERAFQGRVARICQEEIHAGAGRGGDERSPMKAKQRTARGGASAAAAMPDLRGDDADDEGGDEPDDSDGDEPMVDGDGGSESDAAATGDSSGVRGSSSDVEKDVAAMATALGMVGTITAEQRKLLRTMVAAGGGSDARASVGKKADSESEGDDDDGGGKSSAAARAVVIEFPTGVLKVASATNETPGWLHHKMLDELGAGGWSTHCWQLQAAMHGSCVARRRLYTFGFAPDVVEAAERAGEEFPERPEPLPEHARGVLGDALVDKRIIDEFHADLYVGVVVELQELRYDGTDVREVCKMWTGRREPEPVSDARLPGLPLKCYGEFPLVAVPGADGAGHIRRMLPAEFVRAGLLSWSVGWALSAQPTAEEILNLKTLGGNTWDGALTRIAVGAAAAYMQPWLEENKGEPASTARLAARLACLLNRVYLPARRALRTWRMTTEAQARAGEGLLRRLSVWGHATADGDAMRQRVGLSCV